MGELETAGCLSIRSREGNLSAYATVTVGLPATRGWMRQNSVPFTVKMKTPVETRAMFSRTYCWVFSNKKNNNNVLFEFTNASGGELIQSLRHRLL